MLHFLVSSVFFFNDTATTEIYTLSLHDALPISGWCCRWECIIRRSISTWTSAFGQPAFCGWCRDRKSTRLNSSHGSISYAVFCLKKKKKEHVVTKDKQRSKCYQVLLRMQILRSH